MELVDQLLGGDLPIPVVCRLFRDDTHARRALAQYVAKGVITLAGREGPLPGWKSSELLRGPEPLDQQEVRVSLTDKGAKAFEEGNWESI